ncbi:MAG: dihydrodipicolinate synthase family protein [Planctomycetaceae bacterium]|nr:dihydrodipicolinate synthase family protein [Planctomycetaceae bacterium]
MPDLISFVALVTCFRDDESIDYDAIRKQARRQIDAGNNILACGTNGDFTSLLYDEKLKVCETIVDEARGKVKVFANAGCPSTFETVKLGRDMLRTGADALSVIAPYFIACTQEGLYNHFSRVADSVDKPVYLYDIPARTGNHIDGATAMRLADHPNIHGIKDSGGTKKTLDEYIAITKSGKDFTVFAGPDSLIYYAIEKGAGGCVSGLANVAPDTVAAICREFAAGNREESAKQQDILTGIRTDLYAFGYAPAMVKRALYLMDKSVGGSRQPALIPTAELDAKIMAVLKKHGLLR